MMIRKTKEKGIEILKLWKDKIKKSGSERYKVKEGKKDIRFNMRIITGVRTILFIAIIVLLLIGGIGYNSMKKISDNSEAIYDKRLLPITKIGEIQNQYYIIRYNLGKGMETTFYHEYDKNLTSANKAITKLIQQYEEMGVGENEESYLDKFTTNYEEYLSIWADIKKALSDGNMPTSLQQSNLKTIESNLDNSLQGLVRYNSALAKDLKEENSEIYYDNLKVYTVIVIISIILILGFTLIIIKIIKRSMSSMIDNLHKIATGDFTEEITGIGKTEFGIMKKALRMVVDEISNSFKLVKTSSNDVENYSGHLFAVAEQISGSAQGVSRAIQNVSEGANYQSNELQEISQRITEFGGEINAIVEAIEDVHNDSIKTNKMAIDGNENLESLIISIRGIETLFSTVDEKIDQLRINISSIGAVTNIINAISPTVLHSHNLSIKIFIASLTLLIGSSGSNVPYIAVNMTRIPFCNSST